MLNLNHLRLFTAAAEAGSVSAAATRLRLSQPALSKQIRELEAAVGMPLLERQPRGVKTTAAGELLLTYARQLFGLEAEAEQALTDLRGVRRGRLRLGASMTIGVHLLPRLLAQARVRWPGLDIACEIANTDAIQQSLINRHIDLGLVEGPGPYEDRLTSQTFQWDELIVVAGPARQRPALPMPATPAQLSAVPWIMREPGSGTRAVAQAALRKWGLKIEPAWTFNNPEAILRAVAAGLGVALVPRIAVEAELEQGRLVHIPTRGLKLRRPLRSQSAEGRPLSPAAAGFLAMLASNGSPVTSTRADS